MGSSNSKARKESKNQAKNTTSNTTTTAPKSNNMSASSAQVPKPNEVPNTGADASRAAKDSTKTANYFELIEVSHPLFLLIYMLIKKNRRTYYGISDKSTLSNEQITALVGKAVKYAPTSFNMQQNRVIVVTGEKHRKVWDLIIEAQKANDPSKLLSAFGGDHS
jgi:hypothetical protein